MFVASTNQGCEVTIYRQAGRADGVTTLSGKTQSDALPSLVSCHVTYALGGGSSFAFVCKPEAGDTFFDNIVDDDWVDIVLTKNALRWHVMRGLIDEVRRTQSATGSGATVVTYTVAGRSWQKVLLETKVYLNIGQGEDAFGDLARRLADSAFGSLQKVPANIMVGVLRFLADAGRGAWSLPIGMQNVQGRFFDNFTVNTDGISSSYPRITEVAPFAIDNGSVWSLAQQYSDPNYTEMFCEQVNYDLPPSQGFDLKGTAGLDVGDTSMTVVFRDRPFIAVDSRLGTETGKNSPWFKLAQVFIDRQAITSIDLGRSGQERFNSFNLTDAFGQTLINRDANAAFRPVWSPTDMSAHGLRRLDATSNYSFDAQAGAAIGLDEESFQKRRKLLLKDWYALNASYLNGTVQLGTGAPHVHIGTRLYVPGRTPPEDLHAYIEGVSHSWQLTSGTRTSLSVTRGYRGSDEDHLATLQAAAAPDMYQNADFP